MFSSFTLFSAKSSARRSPTVTKLDKSSISFPRPYDWPEFVPATPVSQPALPRVEIDYAPAFGYQSLGCKLLSLEDAQGHVEIVQRLSFRNPKTTRTTTDPTDTQDRGPRTEEHAG
ncbi:uncharacterized protein TRAVEDRAFT_51492 [Trametes versicolor FP-101664 SS1]|uniref:uncharacterized protein n=1 Tax=Trametes versicolor (strain FP-101664) TaxID=717944 RepID=UPI0004623FEF|nr:uncharacterized protein TRAVEDRAFT_51492 [Trametes versicolor FP-101664 SS1]EIW55369.1 hypothetical protein TRAVEDRAFT_51492 [Trametes versicolor FP-101664 SS1]